MSDAAGRGNLSGVSGVEAFSWFGLLALGNGSFVQITLSM
jgi:hypothetical protein